MGPGGTPRFWAMCGHLAPPDLRTSCCFSATLGLKGLSSLEGATLVLPDPDSLLLELGGHSPSWVRCLEGLLCASPQVHVHCFDRWME